MMFRILSIVVFILSFVWIFRYMKKSDISLKNISDYYVAALKNSLSNLKLIKSKKHSKNLESLKNIVYLISILEFFVMVITGFAPLIFIGNNLTGIFLLVHVTIAPIIAITFAILVILFAHSNRFNNSDITIADKNSGKRKINFKITSYLKLNFWLISLFSIPAMLSIILGMFPLFGTEGQINLLETHRYSVLIISVLVIFHIGLLSVNNKQIIKSK